jgi:hypothetical protein
VRTSIQETLKKKVNPVSITAGNKREPLVLVEPPTASTDSFIAGLDSAYPRTVKHSKFTSFKAMNFSGKRDDEVTEVFLNIAQDADGPSRSVDRQGTRHLYQKFASVENKDNKDSVTYEDEKMNGAFTMGKSKDTYMAIGKEPKRNRK